MSEVKRFDSAEVGKHYDISCGMEESPIGDYVLHSDYGKLEARLKVAMDALKNACEALKELESKNDTHAPYDAIPYRAVTFGLYTINGEQFRLEDGKKYNLVNGKPVEVLKELETK